jgi:integrase
MASIHKQPGRPNWFCAFSIFDPQTNRRKQVFRSTKTTDKKQALEICRAWATAAQLGRSGKLSADVAREVIARGVSDVFAASNAEALEAHRIKSWCEAWLQAKEVETAEGTYARYKHIVGQFIEFLGAKANRDLSALQGDDIMRFRAHVAKELSRGTVNLSLIILRVCFGAAVRQGLLTVNPAERVPMLKSRDKSARRAFTLPEIQRILKACDREWRGMVLFGLYLGQRLGDLAKLTWRAVNLESGEIAFTARKTGRRIVLPLMQPLSDYLASLPASDNPDAFIFPNLAKHKRTGRLSNQFRDILVDAGLVEPRAKTTGKGRDQAREPSEISFHSLRHSTVTMLKAANASDFIAREIVGHGSAAVSRQYTHLTTADKRTAMERMPDVTKEVQ